jgi:diguanylate cyclase (GGDEF)-like protein/PAS domain S-box-containing protein
MQNAEKLDLRQPRLDRGSRSCVLVVDDVPTNRSVLKSLLVRPDCEVFEAEDGEQALEIVESSQLDLVVLDIVMPGMNGIDVLGCIRKRFSSSELPVLMLTVKDDIDEVVRALELGANDYVTRPIDYSVLVARINTLISYKKTQDSLRQSQTALESRIAERTDELVQANRALKVESSEREQAEKQVRLSEDRYRLLYNDTPSMFFTLDTYGKILSANQFGADYLGFPVEELVGKRIVDLHEEQDRVQIVRKIQDCLSEAHRVHRWETCMLHSDGSKVWVRTAARVMSGEAEPANSILLVCEDITETYTLSEQLKYQAKHDALTGLVNRYEFERSLQELLNESRRNHSSHALLYMDLDQFKVINDTCGHDAGDELLRQLARLLKKYITDNDTLARLGGDEFAVLLGSCDLQCATSVGQTLHRAITEYRFVWRDASFSVNVSIGVVAIEHTTQDIATLMSAADTACYSAKEEGPKHVHVYQPDDVEVLRRHREMAWIAKINRALEEERFELFYQTIVPVNSDDDALDHSKLHYELLLRMRDEKGKIIKPISFLPAAERYKTTPMLDRWVVKNALKFLSSNPRHLEQLGTCSINLSGHSVSDKDFLYYLLDQLLSSGITPSKICFELTETATIANLASATEFMEILRERGCRFALDDFGTGLSSFEYLKNLPVDFIKIDGQFIRDVAIDPINYAMVRSINEIARVMSKRTVAEFVETEATLSTLREIGIDYAQGNVISIPRPIKTLTAVS